MGMRPDSLISLDKTVLLTCSVNIRQFENVQNISIKWKVNDKEVLEDKHPMMISDQIVSTYQYSPRIEDINLKCGTENNFASLKFSVENNNPILVQLQKLETSDNNRFVWIPFDASNSKLDDNSAEEEEDAVATFRNIYEVMDHEHYSPQAASQMISSPIIGSYHEDNIDVELLRPRTMALTSRSSSISPISTNKYILLIMPHLLSQIFHK